MIFKKACQIQIGDHVANIGMVNNVEVYNEKTKIDIIGYVLSARFFWYDSQFLLYIVDVEKKKSIDVS